MANTHRYAPEAWNSAGNYGKSDILILDEPMNGLDNDGVQDMRKLFLKLKEEGKTILLASHNREDIEVLCDEVYMMDKGILMPVSD